MECIWDAAECIKNIPEGIKKHTKMHVLNGDAGERKKKKREGEENHTRTHQKHAFRMEKLWCELVLTGINFRFSGGMVWNWL